MKNFTEVIHEMNLKGTGRRWY